MTGLNEDHIAGLESCDRDGLAEASSTRVPKVDESLVVLIRADLDDSPQRATSDETIT